MTTTRTSKTVELTNSFHNTRITVDAKWQDDPGESQGETFTSICAAALQGDEQAKRLEARIRRVLCGKDGCQCGVVR
jgi:hypothetical protein